jgi:flagellin-like protein
LIRIRNVRNTTKFKRSIKAISPVIATLLMIAIAVVASLVVYAWVTGYMGGTTSKAGKAIQIQSFAVDNTNKLHVYVQNVGQGAVTIGTAYINGTLQDVTPSSYVLAEGNTVDLTVAGTYYANDKVNIKVATTDGTFMTATGTVKSGGSSGPVVPAITLNPTSGPSGTQVTVAGTNFAASSAITIRFNGVVQTTTPATVTSSAAGAFSCTFNVPSTANGGYTVSATDGSSGSGSSTFTVSTVVVPAITLNPTTGPSATTVTVSGTGFAATSAMNIKFNGVTQTTVPPAVTTSAAGAFSCTFYVPAIAAGPYTVLATDASSGSASTSFTVTATTQYTITFASSGLGGDGSGTLVTYTINGGSQTPIGVAGGSINVNAGDSINYAFQSPIASSGSPSTTRYLWSSTSGLSQTLQTNTFTASATGTITATYAKQTFGIDVSGANAATTASVSVTLSNCQANDVIIVIGSANGNTATSITDNLGSHLTWGVARDTVDQSGHQRLSEYSAFFSAGGSITITVTWASADNNNGHSVVAFAISGAKTPTYFDQNAGLPYSAISTSNNAPSVTGVTTSNQYDMIIGLQGSRAATTETAGNGYTLINSITSTAGSAAAEYQIVTNTLSGATVSFGTSTSSWAMIVDAVQRAW